MRKYFRPHIELLEPRDCPTVAYSFLDAGSNVLAAGTTPGGTLQIGTVGGDLAINGVDTGVAASAVVSARLTGDGLVANAITLSGVDSSSFPNSTSLVVVGGSPTQATLMADDSGGASATYNMTGVQIIRSIGVKIGMSQLSAVSILTPNAGSTVTISQTVSGRTVDVIGGTGTNTIHGPNLNETWNISGYQSGTIGSLITFSNFQNLYGGSAADTFVFGSSSGGFDVVNGGAGINTLDMSGLSIDLTFDVTTNNDGTVNAGIFNSFASMQNLKGGSGDDYFVLSNEVGITGWLDAGAGTNTLDYSAYALGTVNVNFSTGQATNIGGGIRNSSIQAVIYP